MIDGKTLGVDATTLEANAALRFNRSIETRVRKLRIVFEGASRKSPAIEEPSGADIAKLDNEAPKKGSTFLYQGVGESERAGCGDVFMKMKSGGTDMAHKAEHAVRHESGKVLVIARS